MVFAKFLLVAAILCVVVLGIAMRVRAWRIEREKRRRQIERDGY